MIEDFSCAAREQFRKHEVGGPAMRWQLTLAGVAIFVLGSAFASLYTTHSANPVDVASQNDVDASVLFDKHCATCHGTDGQAKTFKAKFNHARNLADTKWQAEASDARIFNSISNGKGKMPAWGKKLSEAQINAL